METPGYEQLKKQAEELTKALDDLGKKQAALVDSTGKNTAAYKALSGTIDKLQKSIKDTSDELTKGISTLNNFNTSAQQNVTVLGLLQLAMNSLTQAHASSSTLVQQLQVNIVSLNNTFDTQTKSLKENKNGFDFHKGAVDALGSSFDKLKSGAGDFAPVLDSVSKGFNGMKSGFEVVKTGFKGVGGAIKATGFGLLQIVLEAITEYFTTDKIGIKRFQGILAGVGVVTKEIKEVFMKLGGVIIDALLHPGDSINKLWNGIIDNLRNRFKAFGVILDGLLHFDTKKIADGVLQLGTGVTNATDKIKTAFQKVKQIATTTAKGVVDAYHEAYNKAGKESDKHLKKVLKNHNAFKKAVDDNSKSNFRRDAPLPDADKTTPSDLLDDDKQQYDRELALLNDALNKKLLSQEEFNKKSKQLRQTHHLDAGIEVKDGEDAPADAETQAKKKAPWADEEAAIDDNEKNGHHIKALQQQKQLLDAQLTAAVEGAKKQGKAIADIELDFANKKAAVEEQLTNAKIHAGDKFINAVLANTKKDSAIYKAAFLAKKATSVADTIISTKQAIIESLKAYAGFPLIGQALGIAQAAFMAAQGASSIATIVKQKPGFASGGQYVSDGRGALLPGYSRTDNTNAYLRSGEAVVVSEAMRNPWARNLVSAINVAHGGRDFAAPNTGRGYAIGGIFTDGGNANRYYNQPVHDIKDLANTMAYQMINNFPPIYVDVKDVNNQQNILAQTVNRVNL